MREIKFRAWDKQSKNIIQPKDGDFIAWHAMSNWQQSLEVMQFTGLLDKNGKEIYESDLIYIAGYGLYEVEFPFTELYEASYEGDIGEIKGNIYENKELLDD